MVTFFKLARRGGWSTGSKKDFLIVKGSNVKCVSLASVLSSKSSENGEKVHRDGAPHLIGEKNI